MSKEEMTIERNCKNCLHYQSDDNACSKDQDLVEIEKPDEIKDCFDLEPWVAKEWTDKLLQEVNKLKQEKIDLSKKIIELTSNNFDLIEERKEIVKELACEQAITEMLLIKKNHFVAKYAARERLIGRVFRTLINVDTKEIRLIRIKKDEDTKRNEDR